jgi:antitoxin component of MazEF toxin-antitoxin module
MDIAMRTLVIRKTGGSLRISIPVEDVRELGLRHGDVAVWKREAGGVRVLRFAKVAELEAAREPETQSAA